MVLYSFLHRGHARDHLRNHCGFSLLEIVLVLFVIGLLAAALAPSVQNVIANSRREAEVRAENELADTIVASFQNTDLTNLNLAALPGTIGGSDTATAFSVATNTGYATTAATDWFAKVARCRGITPNIGTAPSATAQPELYRIACNSLGNPRYFFAAPSEPGRQRFLIVSVTAPAGQLVLPPYEANLSWFDSIWNHDWENRSGQLPAYWSGRITAAQSNAWLAGSGGTTQVYRLCVKRITLLKYRFTINNNHLTDTAWVSVNNISAVFSAAPNSGASTTPEILGGRLLTLNRGTSWPGTEALRFHVSSNDAVTLQ